MTQQPRFKILLALAAVYLIWGSTYFAIKVLVHAVPPFFVSGIRFIVAGAILFAWELSRGTSIPSPRQWFNGIVTGISMILFGYGSVVWTSQFAPSAIIAIMVSAVPIWMTVISLLNPSYACPKLRVYVGLIIGLIGVTIMVNPFELGTHSSIKLEHAAIILFGTLAWSLGSLYSAFTMKKQSMLISISLQMLVGGVALSLVGVFCGEFELLRPESFTWEASFALIYLIIFGSLIAFSAYIWLLNHVAPALAGTYAFVNPLVAMVIGAVLAGELLTPRDLFAAITILLGVVLITLGKGNKTVSGQDSLAGVNARAQVECTADTG